MEVFIHGEPALLETCFVDTCWRCRFGDALGSCENMGRPNGVQTSGDPSEGEKAFTCHRGSGVTSSPPSYLGSENLYLLWFLQIILIELALVIFMVAILHVGEQ